MAKRYSDTDKWKKPFIKSLPAEYKLVWIYLLDECDHAGIWNVEWDTMELRLGIKLSQEKALRLFDKRVVPFDNGTKWFVPDFIEFQYGILNPANKVHGSVIERLKKYKIEGHARGLESPKDKSKDKDKEGGMGETDYPRVMPGLEEMPVNPNAPSKQQVVEFFTGMQKPEKDAIAFYEHYNSFGWIIRGSPITNFRSLANKWAANHISQQQQITTDVNDHIRALKNAK